jgi:hypothetical protein
MKTTMRNSAFMSIALVAALALSSVTRANESNAVDSPKVEFKYIGKVQNQPLFLLNLKNQEGDEYTIRFRDKSGYTFYSNVVKGNFNQRYVVNIDEMEGNTVLVEVYSRKTKKAETFTIKRNQTFLDETVVAKLD